MIATLLCCIGLLIATIVMQRVQIDAKDREYRTLQQLVTKLTMDCIGYRREIKGLQEWIGAISNREASWNEGEARERAA